MIVPESKTALGNKLPRCDTQSKLWENLWPYYLFDGLPLSEYFFDVLVRLHGREGALKHLDKLRQEEKEDIERLIKTSSPPPAGQAT